MANYNTPLHHPVSFIRRILQGAILATFVFVLFLFVGGGLRPVLYNWIVVPLVTVPLAGAAGGVVVYLMDPMRQRGGSQKLLANAISIVVYLLLLVAGFVMGMEGPR